MTYRDLVLNAARELNLVDAEDALEAADATFILGKLNRLLDRWNGLGVASYVVQPTTYTLTPSLNPHTIGPTGTFVVPVRPERIEGAARVSGTTRYPIGVRDEEWFDRLSVQSLTGSFVEELFYRPTWPNGELHFWPVPNAAGSVELTMRQLLASGTLNTTFSLPPGFEDAVTLTLAEDISWAFGVKEVSPLMVAKAQSARNALFSQHGKTHRLRPDSGMGVGGGYFDYRTGDWR